MEGMLNSFNGYRIFQSIFPSNFSKFKCLKVGKLKKKHFYDRKFMINNHYYRNITISLRMPYLLFPSI